VLADHFFETLSLQVFHGDVIAAVRLAPVIDADDVGMVEPGGRLRLAAKTGHELVIAGIALVEDLDRHLAPEVGVAGQEDVSHPAAAQAFDDLVTVVKNLGCVH
jgi:hypothetical protein